MYSNIPIDEGLEAFKEELEKRDDQTIPTEFILKLLKLVLESNIFEFDREFYIQLLGTAMGTRVAPTYANIFMAKLEKFMLENCPENLSQFIKCWKRFIDDIFIIFTGNYEELDNLHKYLNTVHNTMKFDDYQHNRDDNSCNFLDLNIKIENGKICTDLYRKETDKPTALLPSSSHPGHITANIVYSMGFRLLRICSSEEIFLQRLEELKHDFLIPRKYKPSLIDKEFMKVRKIPGENFKVQRREALKKVERISGTKNRVVAPLDYNPLLPPASGVFKKHHKSLLLSAPHLAEIFPSPPMPAYRQPRNIRSILCRSKLFPVNRSNRLKRATHRDAPGWNKCGKQCKVCPYTLDKTQAVTGTASGYVHEITQAVTCDTSNCVYYWKCIKANCQDFPNCEYIGMTTRKFKDRLAEHRDYPKRNVITEPSGFHFNQPGHTVAHLKGLVLEKVRNQDPFVLKAREHLLIQKFNTFRAGLNQEP